MRELDIIDVRTGEVLSRFASPRKYRMVRIEQIAEEHGVPVADIMARTRMSQNTARARHEAMAMLRRDFGDSTTQIGRLFNRDHTTVIYALRKVEASL